MDIVDAYRELGTYRGAAELCGTTHKTVKRVMAAQARGEVGTERAVRRVVRNTDCVADLVAKAVRKTDGRISAKRLPPKARAGGYTGSARNFRRAVAAAKRAWQRQRRTYRPWVPHPGEHIVHRLGHRGGLAGVGAALEPVGASCASPLTSGPTPPCG